MEISLLHMAALYDGTLDQCQALGAHPMAWSPLAKGLLATGSEGAAVRTREALGRIAGEYEATAEQIALAWVLALPSAPQVVIGTNQPERIRISAQSDGIVLERQHWYELWQAAQGHSVP